MKVVEYKQIEYSEEDNKIIEKLDTSLKEYLKKIEDALLDRKHYHPDDALKDLVMKENVTKEEKKFLLKAISILQDHQDEFDEDY